jgi:hypothetical protein
MDNQSSLSVDFRNNIIYDVNDGDYFTAHDATEIVGNGTHNNNIWYDGEGGSGTPANAPAWDTSPIETDPSFVSAGSDFHLQAGSPAIDAGFDTSATVAKDLDGVSRTVTLEIGVYEYGGPSPVNPSLTSATISDVTTLTLAFNENVTQGAGYADSDWDIDCDDSNISVAYLSGDGTTSHTYTISQVIYRDESCDIDFDGSANSEEDGDGNDLAAIVSGTVTNNSNMHKIEGVSISRR